MLLPWSPLSLPPCLVPSLVRRGANRKSLKAGWIMVMSQRPGAWWEWRWACGGWLSWIWGRLWKYEGLEFRVSSAPQRLRESYLKQINFLWRSVSLSLSVCLCKLKNCPINHFGMRTLNSFTSSVRLSLTLIDSCSVKVRARPQVRS